LARSKTASGLNCKFYKTLLLFDLRIKLKATEPRLSFV
jgi:hypothetical protein